MELIKLNEFDLLTLREGLFSIRHNKEIVSTDEFMELDNKICKLVTKLDNDSEVVYG